MGVTVGTSRSGNIAQPGDTDRTQRTGGDPTPVSPPVGPVAPPGPMIPAQRQGAPGGPRGGPTYVGRVGPPATKLPTVPKQRAFGQPGARPVPRPPRYRYELTDLDDIFATARANTDPLQERAHDIEQRHTGWKVIFGALIVVVVVTVVAAFFVAGLLRGVTSLVP
jgi:hypothetical protein